jgi:nucleotide-binding universal stress UspA family protein
MMGLVYENVIVPFEGTLESKRVLAPASDLAWRCGAHMVVVSNTDASDKSSKAALKVQAMAKSGSDVEFWVDLEHSVVDAALKAVAYRQGSMLCVATSAPTGALHRKRRGPGQLVQDIVARATVPVLVVGPRADLALGLAMTELVVILDCTPSAESLLAFAIEWATAFKLRLVVAASPAPGTSFSAADLQQYLDQRIDGVSVPGGVRTEGLAEGGGPATVVALLDAHDSAVGLLTANHGKAGGLGSFSEKVVAESPRPVLVRPG